jgi:AraC family transcriptional regulator
MALQLWQLVPELSTHVYWNRKAAFLRKEDTYTNWCLLAVEDGEFKYTIGDHHGTAGFGELVLCPPGMSFERSVVTPLSFHFMLLGWRNSNNGDTYPSPALADGTVDPGLLPSGKLVIHDTNRLKSIFSYLRSPLPTGDPFVHSWKSHLLRDLWMLYCTELQTTLSGAIQPTTDPLMEQAALLIQRSADQPLRMKAVSDCFGLTQVQFSRRFFAAYRLTPVDYLISLRLQKACTLLLETDLTLDGIALRCGYQNGYYISRLFSSKLNTTPSQYRKTHHL